MQHKHLSLKFLLVLVCSFLNLGFLSAQHRDMKIKASGYIYDSETKEALYAATVQVTSADGGTGTFGITNEEGKFEFEVNRPGKYTLDFSFVGYKKLSKEVNIWPGRGATLGKFMLEPNPVVLEEVGTVARSQRVKQVGDTVMYNADAYKVADGASAEELVAKMPGIEVTDDGVKAQGETVEKVLVDGKEFFENDPKLALKALPAEVVQSVAVFDKKSDQAEFTGFDDGNSVKAMDLKTKSYRRNGAFGKIYGGGGFDADWNPYYKAGFNVNFFNGDRRISVLGLTNNVNQQDFSFDDLQSSGGMGGRGGRWGNRMGSQSGVSRANAIGLNFSNTLADDKLDIQGSYFFNMQRTTLSDSILDDYINTARSSIQTDDKLSHNYRHRMNMRIKYAPNENNEIMFRPRLTFQSSDSKGLTNNITWRESLDSVIYNPDFYYMPGNYQNRSYTLTTSDNDSWNVGGSLTWRHKMAKEGRTVSVRVDGSLSGSSTDSENNKDLNFVKTFQGSDSDTKNYNIGGNVMYTEPIGENQQLSGRYSYNYRKSTNDRTVSYYTDETFTVQDSIDVNNSSKYTSEYSTHSGQLGYRFHNDYVNLSLEAGLEHAILDGRQNYIYWNSAVNGADPSYTTSKTYNSFIPRMRIEWSPIQNVRMDFNYSAESNAPSISNLQQSVNTANELNYSTGNPDLGQSQSHSFRMGIMYSNMERATNFMFFSGLSTAKDYIGQQYIINNSDETVALTSLRGYEDAEKYAGLNLISGSKISKPVNMDGNYNIYAGCHYGFPLDLIMSNVNVGANFNYNKTPSQQLYFNGFNASTHQAEYEDYSTKVRNFSVSPNISINSNISQDLDFSVSYRPSFQRIKDTENESNNYKYLTHNVNGKVKWVFWKGFTMEHSLNYTYYTGSSMNENIDELTWNASIGKKFGKTNQFEVQLQGYDILGQRTGYRLSNSDSYIRTSYTNYMPRYFMVHLTYKLANYKGMGETKSDRRQGQGQGRQGGGRPDMMF